MAFKLITNCESLSNLKWSTLSQIIYGIPEFWVAFVEAGLSLEWWNNLHKLSSSLFFSANDEKFGAKGRVESSLQSCVTIKSSLFKRVNTSLSLRGTWFYLGA